MKMRITAFGQDTYWLTAVQQAITGLDKSTVARKRRSDFVRASSDLPRPNDNTLLLVDASETLDMENVVTRLRSDGWKYIVVVAARPSARQATSVLRGDLAYDYWKKTYDEKEIQEQLHVWLTEINAEK